MNNAQVSESNLSTKESFQTLEVTSDLPKSEGNATAVVAKVSTQQPKVEPAGRANILAGIAPVTSSSEFY